jgi:S1-C subfamily serine protease
MKVRLSNVAILIASLIFACSGGNAAPSKHASERASPEAATKVFEEARSSIYQIRTLTVDGDVENSTGSGFLVGTDGLIATNWHVIASMIIDPEGYRLEAMRIDGRRIPVSIVAIDAMNDLALIRAAGETGMPLLLHLAPLAKGDRGFSLGNPKGIGFTVVEGTYNGVAAKSLSGNYHFTAAINAGMSGGPALTTTGEVFGINVARRTDADLIGFLVPAEKLAALIVRGRTANPTREALLGEARQGMIDGQEKLTGDTTRATPKMRQIGPFVLPAESGSASRCGGTSSKEDDEGYAMESASCMAFLSITAGRKHSVGLIWSEYNVMRNLGLDPIRFAARLSAKYAKDRDDEGERKTVSRYKCRTSFVQLKGGVAQVTLCTRAYKKLDGLLDAHLRLVTVDGSDVGLVGDLLLRGFTENNIKKLTRWYLETIEWKH